MRVGYAKGDAANEAALLDAVGLAGAQVVTLGPNWAEQVVRFLTNPVVAPLLLSLGVLGLVFEVKTGAFGLGGLLSLASLGLFFGSSFVLGLAGWEEILLLGLGLIALAIEVFVLPGFGVAGVLGLVAVGVAIVMAMIGAAPTGGDIGQALAVLGASLVITAAVLFALAPSSAQQRHGSRDSCCVAACQQSEGYIAAPAERAGGSRRRGAHRSASRRGRRGSAASGWTW